MNQLIRCEEQFMLIVLKAHLSVGVTLQREGFELVVSVPEHISRFHIIVGKTPDGKNPLAVLLYPVGNIAESLPYFRSLVRGDAAGI